jgi:paraquat-inducible protein B
MTESRENPGITEALPSARVQRRRWKFPIVWVVPVIAAIVAGYLVYGRLQEFGPTITIKFKDGSGIKAGQTEIRYRGVRIGEVTTIELSEDQEYVVVRSRRVCVSRHLRSPRKDRFFGLCVPSWDSEPSAD